MLLFLRLGGTQRLLSSEESSNSMVAVKVVVLAGSSLGFVLGSSTLFTVAIKHLSCISCMAVTRGLLQFSSHCKNFSPCFMASRCSLSGIPSSSSSSSSSPSSQNSVNLARSSSSVLLELLLLLL
uniref:Uncharacterized protein n=1 Tax=Glossina palpalis gambiensis TaxID=67801 RepID=A0A1B0BB38_9MUSC